MALFIEIFSWLFLMLGVFCTLVGGIGLFRLPDFYTRVHASGVTDTLGAACIIIGLILQVGLSLLLVKLLLIIGFLILSGPAATHALAQTAFRDGLKPQLDEDRTP